MNEPAKYRVTLPTGQKTKPYSRAKITAALEAGKIPGDATVDVDGSSVDIRSFCTAVARQPSTSEPTATAVKRKPSRRNEEVVLTTHPAMFRNNPILFVVAVALIAVGIGLVFLLIWWIQCLCTTLMISDRKTTLRHGILSKSLNEVRHKDVRNVQVYQSFLQRIFGVGKLSISSAGQGGVEIEVAGIRNPVKVKSMIDEYRDE